MNGVLLLEPSKTIGSLISRTLKEQLCIEVDCVRTFAEGKALIESGKVYDVAITDLNLSDAEHLTVIDYIIGKGLPLIITATVFDDEVRESMWSKSIADYIIKDDLHIIEYLGMMVSRLINNKNIGILIVDDSRTSRRHVRHLLEAHRFDVQDVTNGNEALHILQQPNHNIRLVITDYNMPVMNGYDLTREIRKVYKRHEMAIIGISSLGNAEVSTRFIKHGANDFLCKPFSNEEFYCRLIQNVELVEYVEKIRNAVYKDYLTGLYSRRYVYEVGELLIANQRRDALHVTAALVDIDFFKKVNDTYGHDAGDIVLKHLAEILKSRFRASDIVGRLGGEEFVILASNMNDDAALPIFETLCKLIAQTPVTTPQGLIHYTVSIGFATMNDAKNLDALIKAADIQLYRAKNGGRNCVKFEGIA